MRGKSCLQTILIRLQMWLLGFQGTIVYKGLYRGSIGVI